MKAKSLAKRAKAKGRGRSRRRKSTAGAANTVKLVRIGNSRGVRLPKAVIEQARLGDEVELVVRDHEVVLKSLEHPRAGWDEAMRRAIAEHGADPTEEDREWLDAPIDAPVDDEKEWPW
jgi:antitoxin MazE